MSSTNYSVNSRAVQELLEAGVKQAEAYCGSSQRARQVSATRLVQLLVLGWLAVPTASLNDLALQAHRLNCSITAQALHERINGRTVMLLAAVLQQALRQLQQGQRLPVTGLQQFSAIHLLDSTQIELPSSLAGEFAGCKGNAMLKLQVQLDYLHGNLTVVDFGDGRTPDQVCQLHVDNACPGSLQLFDLGFFKQEYLRDIDGKDAFFVCRYQTQTALYDPTSGQRVLPAVWLEGVQADEVERIFLLGGRTQHPLRLVARRVPLPVAQARRRRARKEARRQGQTCSQAYLALLDWELLLTNLSADDWSRQHLFDLYAIRWQIELIFRAWKAQLKLAHIGSWRPARVLCQLYAHLIGAVLCHHLSAPWRYRAGVEYSFSRCIQVIAQSISAILHCIAVHWRNWPAVQRWLDAAFDRFARKHKRKKSPSTCQTLINWGLS
jgi:hypothetical protein